MISIPDSVLNIGVNVFKDTPWFNSQADGVVYAGKVALCWKGPIPDNKKLNIFPGTLGVAWGAFQSINWLTEIVLPDGLQYIGKNAFQECRYLKKIDLPSSLIYIGNSAFESCSGLPSILDLPHITEIGGNAFRFSNGLSDIVIGPDCQTVGSEAFCSAYHSWHLSVRFLSGNIKIGNSAFSRCTDLEVTIPEGNTVIGKDAFYGGGKKTVHFLGDKATFLGEPDTYNAGTTFFYYPCNNTTWIGDYLDTVVLNKEHNFGDWEETKAPSCNSNGEEHRICIGCGIEETRKTYAIGHTDGEPIEEVEIAPTCGKPGRKHITIHCIACGELLWEENVEIPATGSHSFGAWTVMTPATVDKEGEETRVCSVCGAKETRAIPKLTPPDEPTPELKPGDVDGDGEITAADARLALRRAVDLEDYAPGSAEFLACDVDKDGDVTAADARLILRAAVDLEDPTKW